MLVCDEACDAGCDVDVVIDGDRRRDGVSDESWKKCSGCVDVVVIEGVMIGCEDMGRDMVRPWIVMASESIVVGGVVNCGCYTTYAKHTDMFERSKHL